CKGGFMFVSDPSKQIQFPRQGEPIVPTLACTIVANLWGEGVLRALSCLVVKGAIDGWIKKRFCDSSASAELFHARGCCFQVVVVSNRFSNQILQDFVLENNPPRNIRDAFGSRRTGRVAIVLRRFDFWPAVLGSQRASDQCTRHKSHHEESFHDQCPPS